MINLAQIGVRPDVASESRTDLHYRQRMKLIFAVFDVEMAHSHLAELNPGDRQYSQRLEQLNVALDAYWRIDEQVEKYIQNARGN